MTSIMYVTSYDDPTIANAAIAEIIIEEDDLALIGRNATREALLAALMAPNNSKLFAMAHGEKKGIRETENCLALESEECAILHGKHIYAWACHTGSQIGYHAATAGAWWWGYDCAVTAPDGSEKFAGIFADIFSFIKRRIYLCASQEDALGFLDDLKGVCEVANAKLDDLIDYSQDDYLSLYSCCSQIWWRLRVWVAGSAEPLKHPDSPPPYIDI